MRYCWTDWRNCRISNSTGLSDCVAIRIIVNSTREIDDLISSVRVRVTDDYKGVDVVLR